MPSYGHHSCGGQIVDAELSCAIGERDGALIAVLLPGFTCTRCGEPQLHSEQVELLEGVLAGAPYEHLKYVRLGTDRSAPLTAIAV